MLKQQARSALEGYFDVTLTQLAERHPFTYAGVNEDGCVDIFIYYVEPNEEVIHLDLAILSHAHGLSGVTLKHCILVSNQSRVCVTSSSPTWPKQDSPSCHITRLG